MRRRDLADVQRLELAPFAEILQNLQQAAQIYGVLGQPGAAVGPHRDRVGGPLRKLVRAIQHAERVDERRALAPPAGPPPPARPTREHETGSAPPPDTPTARPGPPASRRSPPSRP